MKKAAILLLKLSVTTALIAALLARIDIGQAVRSLAGAQWPWLAITCLTWPLGISLSALKWRGILAYYGIPLSVRQAINLYWIGTFFNNFLPGAIGGDAVKFVYTNRLHPGKKPALFSSLVIERGMGLYAATSIGLGVSLPFLDHWIASLSVRIAVFSGLLVLAVLPLAGAYALRRANLRFPTGRGLWHRLLGALHTVMSFHDGRSVLFAYLYSAAFFGLSVLSYSLLFRSLGTHVDPLLIAFLLPMIGIVELIPLAINSFGLKEGAAVALFAHFGCDGTATLSVFLMARLIGVLFSATGGLRFLALKDGVTIRSLRKADGETNAHPL